MVVGVVGVGGGWLSRAFCLTLSVSVCLYVSIYLFIYLPSILCGHLSVFLVEGESKNRRQIRRREANMRKRGSEEEKEKRYKQRQKERVKEGETRQRRREEGNNGTWVNGG